MKARIKELETLVNQKLDGTLTSDGQQALDEILFSSEEARQYLREMEKLDDLLRAAAIERVQPDLSSNVMERIDQEHHSGFLRGNKSLIRRVRQKSRQLMRYAALLAIGLLLGSGLTLALLPGGLSLDRDDLAGAMSARSGHKMAIAQNDWQIQINPVVVQEMTLLVLSVSAEQPIEINISYDPQAYRLVRARYLSGIDRGASMLTGGVRFEVNGEAVYQLVLNKHSGLTAPLALEVTKNGQVEHYREILIQ